jgi:hypothetical protein
LARFCACACVGVSVGVCVCVCGRCAFAGEALAAVVLCELSDTLAAAVDVDATAARAAEEDAAPDAEEDWRVSAMRSRGLAGSALCFSGE